MFEDSQAGLQAAHAGKMFCVGIGTPQRLPEADLCMPGFRRCVTMQQIEKALLSHSRTL